MVSQQTPWPRTVDSGPRARLPPRARRSTLTAWGARTNAFIAGAKSVPIHLRPEQGNHLRAVWDTVARMLGITVPKQRCHSRASHKRVLTSKAVSKRFASANSAKC
eukprot:EC789208.1.p3 GENE.EC789208.1~~EC789208.1.p3  ORF type:complete len:106 (+),score=0.32 EC789208.1:199-516(+)